MSPAANSGAPSPAISKAEVLRRMQAINRRLLSGPVQRRIKQLPEKKRQEVVAQRIHFSTAVRRLSTALVRDIRRELETHSADLQAGIQNLEESLETLGNATRWAKAIGGFLQVLGRVVDILA